MEEWREPDSPQSADLTGPDAVHKQIKRQKAIDQKHRPKDRNGQQGYFQIFPNFHSLSAE